MALGGGWGSLEESGAGVPLPSQQVPWKRLGLRVLLAKGHPLKCPYIPQRGHHGLGAIDLFGGEDGGRDCAWLGRTGVEGWAAVPEASNGGRKAYSSCWIKR